MRGHRAVLVAGAMLCAPVWGLAAEAAPPALFAEAVKPAPGDDGSTPSLRSRAVVLDAEGVPSPATPVGTLLTANLFADTTLIAEVRTVEAPPQPTAGSVILTGVLADEPESTFIIARRGGAMAAEFRSPSRGDYEVRLLAGGFHVVRQIDHAGFLPCAMGPEHAVGAPGEQPLGLRSSTTPRMNIMIVYTDQARTGAGGQAGIDSIVDLAITQANQVYVNSQVNAQLVLVYRGLVAYTESGSAGTDLSALRSTSDGNMDSVHCNRDRYGADFVSLLVNSFNACGIAYLMVNVGTGFATSAFCVVDKDCVSGYTFAHEVGHNLGCHHDRDNASAGAFSYSYGYRTPDQVYRTVMAYAPGTRVGRFSNPDITYQGYIMGIALGQPGETHNALTINNTAPTAVNFRGAPQSAPDYNLDTMVDVRDIFDLIAGWFAFNPRADYDQSTTFTVADIFRFLGHWFSPLPPC